MRLHQNKQLFRQSVQFTAQQMNIPAIYVEKDYWVTFALHNIFHHPIGKEAVFKGGTALSKCFNLINRFSEDIDLVVLRREGESNNKLTNKIKKISEVVAAVLPEVDIMEVTQKMGMNRKTAHTYSKEFNGNYGQVRDVIIVEATWLGYFEPFVTKQVSSFIYAMMQETGQQLLATTYDLLPFEVLALEPKRTICEKIMSLVRFSYTENPLEDLKKKIRHTYDLHQLLQEKELLEFFHTAAFDEMILKVANDDIVSFKNNNDWLQYHPKDAKIFVEIDTVWNDLKATYNGPFKNLVFGNLPAEEQVLKTLKSITKRLALVEWNIHLSNQQ
jgi:predicted nucleotidyltransferase component of viral defense system